MRSTICTSAAKLELTSRQHIHVHITYSVVEIGTHVFDLLMSNSSLHGM